MTETKGIAKEISYNPLMRNRKFCGICQGKCFFPICSNLVQVAVFLWKTQTFKI